MSFTILRVDSSPLGEGSVSRKLTAKVVAELVAKRPGAKVIERDLSTNPLPHLSASTIGGFFTAPQERDAALAQAVELSDIAVDEFLGADAIVIGAPMYNLGIPSALKAWIDHIVRAGRTFRYTEAGPVGLAPAGKKVIVVSARGGVFNEGPRKALDYQEAYLETVLGFLLGLTDISFVRAEGLSLGPDAASAAIEAAEAQAVAAVRDAA